jgi:hypothetical protein
VVVAHVLPARDDLRAEALDQRIDVRPAVIARNLSCGNKTDRGRRSWEILASLGATHHQTGGDYVAFLASRLGLTKKGR